METPLKTNWQFTQYLPAATSAPQASTPTAAAAPTWPGVTPPAHSPVSDQSSLTYDIVVQEPN
eukprot:2906976-Prorocentrum_lima.AAC.1